MVNVYLNLSIFTVFLKIRNFISIIRRSKVTDYAALIQSSRFQKQSLRSTIRVPYGLDLDQIEYFVRPDLGPSCLQMFND